MFLPVWYSILKCEITATDDLTSYIFLTLKHNQASRAVLLVLNNY